MDARPRFGTPLRTDGAAVSDDQVGAEREAGLVCGQLSAAVRRSNDMIFVVDLAGIIRSVNPAAARITGFSSEEMLGTHFGEYVAAADGERADALFARHVAGADVANEEVELVAKDGRRVFLEVSARPIETAGQLLGLEGIARDVTERHELQGALVHRAFHDSLTSLPNRALFFDRVAQALARAERRPSTVAVMLLDLDRFKLINDSLGHPAGDEVLVAVAQRLRRVLRGSDSLARLGGDEFAVVFEGLEAESELALPFMARRILEALAEPFVVGDLVEHVTGSLGIAVAEPGDNPVSLLRNADNAMYQAKKDSPGAFTFFDGGQRTRARRELELGAALAYALQHGELLVYYQPIVSLAGGSVLAVEALTRWLHPQWGWVSPAEFIPVAERSGSIVPLGKWMLAEAVRQAACGEEYPEALPLGVYVNVSPAALPGGLRPVSGGDPELPRRQPHRPRHRNHRACLHR
jgi:diguanylate cyclase (GGDEF)-like protein/PAS domain S-box-containing protein